MSHCSLLSVSPQHALNQAAEKCVFVKLLITLEQLNMTKHTNNSSPTYALGAHMKGDPPL
jgi:hypothetical protein